MHVVQITCTIMQHCVRPQSFKECMVKPLGSQIDGEGVRITNKAKIAYSNQPLKIYVQSYVYRCQSKIACVCALYIFFNILLGSNKIGLT